MSAERSPATGRRYPLTQVCRVSRVPRSTVYDTAARTASPQGPPSAKRGPKTPASDETLVTAIRAVLAATPFHGEGHRKVRVRLRQQGHRVSRNRVLRLMRLHGLLAPQRAGHRHGDPAHAGTITPAAPNVLWGTDATRFYTAQEGWCWWFGAIDHASADIVGWHVAKIGDRWAALEPVHQGMRHGMLTHCRRAAPRSTLRMHPKALGSGCTARVFMAPFTASPRTGVIKDIASRLQPPRGQHRQLATVSPATVPGKKHRHPLVFCSR